MAIVVKALANFYDSFYPAAGLITDANGDLFGTTAYGGYLNVGPNGYGTMFEIAKTSTGYASTPNTLISFNGANGAYPYDSLIIDANGDVFGTTAGDGTDNEGTVFELAKTSTGYASLPSTLVSFDGTNGSTPIGSLIADASGNLFGTTEGPQSTGTVFEIAKTSTGYVNTPATLATVGGYLDGGLIADSNGNLFGTTELGGASGDGSVFEIAKTASGYDSNPTTLVSFNGSDGSGPTGSLIADSNGDLFGTTGTGGADNDGTVFEIPRTSIGYSDIPITLVSFDGTDGADPYNEGLITDANGDLFGTTSDALGSSGTAFEIVKTASGYADTPTTLATFNTNGNVPNGGLIADVNGDLFGVTGGGGTLGDGTVFEITGSGFATAALCFCAGTVIATPRGEIPVERLAVGDSVLTRTGRARPISWIGIGRVLATRGRRNAATPVIVRKGALADNVPHHDLRVTKGHALYVDDVLIPVEFLVNHRSILWDDHAQEAFLYHIELETHDVLLANGAPAESYRDDGNRWLFQNANSGWGLPPQIPCAPVLTGGPMVDAVWQRLLDRSGPRRQPLLTDDADVYLRIDGCRLDAAERTGEVHVFRLSAIPSSLSIVSRAAAPAELGLARDPRVLGVALRRIVVRKGTRFAVIEAADERLTVGFHAYEPDNGFRWTDGDAVIPASLYAGFPAPLELVVRVEATARYLAEGPVHRSAA